jgi:hypothetical protein
MLIIASLFIKYVLAYITNVYICKEKNWIFYILFQLRYYFTIYFFDNKNLKIIKKSL